MQAGRYKLWGPNLLLGSDVSPGGSGRRKVLGIIGYGRIGQAVARRSVGFDMEVLAHDPFNREGVEQDDLATWAELDELLERSDFVSLHPALTEDTHHLIGETELARMKPTACLINVSRGPVIDEEALVRALREEQIGGAALDVFEDEPAMKPGLAALAEQEEGPTVVIVPHIGSATRDTRDKMATMSAENALAHLRQERAPNCVNPEVYDTEEYENRLS
jgi:glyoxylate reductase